MYKITLCLNAACLLFTLTFFAQEISPPKYSVDGDVYASLVHGDTLILGGTFSSVGLYSGGGAYFNIPGSTPDLSLPKLVGTVFKSTEDGNGGLYIFGAYYHENEAPSTRSPRIEHILANGTFEEGFLLPVVSHLYDDASIQTLLYSNGKLFIGAGNSLASIGGYNNLQNFFAFDVATRQPVTNLPQANGVVTYMTVHENVLYIGGDFTTLGTLSRTGEAAINLVTNTITPWQPNINGGITSMVFYQGNAIIGGSFIDPDEELNYWHAKLASVDLNTGSNVQYIYHQSSPDENNLLFWAHGWVHNLALSGNTLYAHKSMFGDNYIEAIDLTTNIPLWERRIDATVTGYKIVSGTLYIAGAVNKAYLLNTGAQPENIERNYSGLMAIDLPGGNLSAWNPNLMGWSRTANSMSLLGNKLFVGGTFSHINGEDRRNICMINTTMETLLPFSLPLNNIGEVDALATDGERLYIGGVFNNVANTEINKPLIAADLTTGAYLPGWLPLIEGQCKSLAVNESTVYASGNLYIPGSSENSVLVAINKTNAMLNTSFPKPNGLLGGIYLTNGSLYAGGEFSEIGGVAKNNLAAINAQNNTIANWSPVVPSSARSIASDSENIYTGNDFTGYNDNAISAFNKITGENSFNIPMNNQNWGRVSDIIVKDNFVLFAGITYAPGNETCINIMVYNKHSGTVSTIPDVCITGGDDNRITQLELIGDDLYIAGRFLQVNNSCDSRGIYRMRLPEEILGHGLINNNKQKIMLYPNPARDYVAIETMQNINNCKINVYDQLGRKLSVPITLNGNKAVMDVRSLITNNGMYYITVNADGKEFKEKLILKQ